MVRERGAGAVDGSRAARRGQSGALALAFAVALAAAACAGAPPAPPGAAPRVVLLGELHDNADGHARRLAWLAERVDAGWRPVIAMEQFDRDRQADLDRALAECAAAACVIRRAGSAGQAWEWKLYAPVIELAIERKLRLRAANLSRADASKVVRGGFRAALDDATIAAFGLEAPLPADLADGQRRAIDESHCGTLPTAIADGMVRAQVARDVWMAKVVAEEAARGNGVALLAGNGHVRRDLGVPRWLAGTAAAGAVAIGFVEEPAEGVFDVRVAVAPHEREDPCAKK